MSQNGTIDVVLADDHPIVLHGLQSLIDREPDMCVVATARDGEEAVEKVLASNPHVTVMDGRMPRRDGIEAVRMIMAANPAARIILVSGAEDPNVALEALRAGAIGFVSKAALSGGIVEAIRRAAAGEPVLIGDAARQLIQALTADRNGPDVNPLSAPEVKILQFVADGQTNEQIARSLEVSLSSVKAKLTALFAKVEAVDRASALAICFRRGWLS